MEGGESIKRICAPVALEAAAAAALAAEAAAEAADEAAAELLNSHRHHNQHCFVLRIVGFQALQPVILNHAWAKQTENSNGAHDLN